MHAPSTTRSGPSPSGHHDRLWAPLIGALAAVAIPLTAAPPVHAQAPKPPHVLRTNADGWVSRLGPVRVDGRRPSLPNAYRAFGRPTSATGSGNLRRVRWKAAGVSIVATTFGLCRRRTCATSELHVQSARVSGPRWQTAAGLRVGDPMARIGELYSADPPADGSANVVVQDVPNPFGDGGDLAIVTAEVRGGVVRALRVWVGGAGE
jgi:hypothetical protein